MQTEKRLGAWNQLPPPAQSILLLLIGSIALLGFALIFAGRSAQPLLYFKVVVIKGLLPQLILTLLFLPLLRRFRVKKASRAHAREAANPGAGTLLLECFIMAALAFSAVVPFFLNLDLPGWPALRMIDAEQRIGNFVAMTLGVTLLVWWPRWRAGPDLAKRQDEQAGP